MGARKRKLTDEDRRAVAKVRELWADFQKKNPGVSQEAAAARAGMSQSAFSQFLMGRVPMRVTPVIKFARLFGVEPSSIRDDLVNLPYAIGTKATQLEVREPAPLLLPAGALEIAKVFSKLSPQTQEMFRELLFMYSAVDKFYPWLRRGRPKGESYSSYERRLEQNMTAMIELAATRRLKMRA